MPNCDGHQFVLQLRQQPQAEFIPVIFLSARTTNAHQQEGFESGVDSYICKPIERSQRPTFLSMIKSLLIKSVKCRESLSSSAKDQLTNLHRREAFFEALKRQISLHQRDDEISSIAILDIDHFKLVNDTYGHLVGDKILAKFAGCLTSSLRKSDQVFRYGGEEFVILFPNTSGDTLKLIMARVKKVIKEAAFEKELGITFSSGLAELPIHPQEERCEYFVQLADQALYEAKNTGRNKIMLYNHHEDKIEEADYECKD